MSILLMNKLLLNKKLYGLKMREGLKLNQHINVFNGIISDMRRVDMKFEKEDMTLMLLNYLLMSYKNLITMLIWRNEILELEEIISVFLAFN